MSQAIARANRTNRARQTIMNLDRRDLERRGDLDRLARRERHCAMMNWIELLHASRS